VKYCLGLLLVGLLGCTAKVATPPPPPVITGVLFGWSGPGNTLPACPSALACNASYTISDKTSGVVIATVPIPLLSYLLNPAPPAGLHSYGLVVNIQNPDGSTATSPQALTVVTLP
jgi:hypothetical protein